MLAVGPSELTKNFMQELSKDMTMRWSMVTDKPQEFLGRSLCQTPQSCTFGVPSEYVTKLCKDFDFGHLKGSNTLNFENPDDNDTPWTNLDNDVTDSCLVGYTGWIVLTSRTQFVCCPLASALLPLVMKSTSSVC